MSYKNRILFIFFLFIFTAHLISYGAAESFPYQEEKPRINAEQIRSLYFLKISDLQKKLKELSDSEALQKCMVLGAMAMAINDTKKGETYFSLALEYAEKASLIREKVAILVSLAMIKSQQDNEEKCLDYLLQAKEFTESGIVEDEKLKVGVLIELGECYYRLGMYKDSQLVYADAVVLSSNVGNQLISAKCKMGLAYAYMKQGIEKNTAKSLFESAGKLYEDKEMVSDAAEALKCLGNLESDPQKSKEFYNKALALYKQSGNIHGQGNCNFNLGIVYQNKGDYPKALSYFQEAMHCYTQSRSTTGIGIAQLKTGETYTLMNKLDEAESTLKQAAFMLEKAQSWDRLGETEEAFGDLYLKKNDIAKAKRYYQNAIKRFNELKLFNRTPRLEKKLKEISSEN